MLFAAYLTVDFFEEILLLRRNFWKVALVAVTLCFQSFSVHLPVCLYVLELVLTFGILIIVFHPCLTALPLV